MSDVPALAAHLLLLLVAPTRARPVADRQGELGRGDDDSPASECTQLVEWFGALRPISCPAGVGPHTIRSMTTAPLGSHPILRGATAPLLEPPGPPALGGCACACPSVCRRGDASPRPPAPAAAPRSAGGWPRAT